MKRGWLAFSLLLALAPAAAQSTPRSELYLQTARAFVETMMRHGTDHYGPVHSPLFAAMLDLDRLELPVQKMPEGFHMGRNGMYGTIGFGFPDMPVFIRNIDRSPFGNNMELDVQLLHAMYALSDITGLLAGELREPGDRSDAVGRTFQLELSDGGAIRRCSRDQREMAVL